MPGPDIDIMRSKGEFLAAIARTGDRLAFEELLTDSLRERREWTLPGFCQACDVAAQFAGDWAFSDGSKINFRERLVCPRCELNNRQRFMAKLVRDALARSGGDPAAYLYEQVTPFFRWAERALPARVVGSEYLGHGLPGGTVFEGVRHEDALALSFEDAAFDVVVSNDVFEHVPDIERSLAECARVLRPGGRLYFSIPFYADRKTTVRRAELRNGELVELLPSQFHGNPISSKGSLVFFDYGWDVLAACRAAGFRDAYMVGYWSLLYGYLGSGMQPAFVAEH
jgi:SAM-dependent methyltransferase